MTRKISNISEYIRSKINNHTALNITVKLLVMKKNIDNYIDSIIHDNEDAIMNGWYNSIADYIIHNAENGAGWYEYFDDSETDDNLGEPTQEQIDELQEYLNENYNYLPS